MTVDDLGVAFHGRGPAARVVSLVPSLTEALASVRPEALVGATDWCTHPADLSVQRVRGTKNPNLQTIKELRPDVVVANKEENRELDVLRLREAGVPVWVTVTESVPQALASMVRLFRDCLQWPEPSWLAEATHCGTTRSPRPPFAPLFRSGETPGWWWGRRRSPVTSSDALVLRMPTKTAQSATRMWNSTT